MADPKNIGIFGKLIRSKQGAIPLAILSLMYLIALLADFLAPYDVSDQDLSKTYHPPTSVIWKEGCLQVKRYRLIDKSTAQYKSIPDETVPLAWFHKGKLFTVEAPDRIYLLGSDSTGRDIFSRLLFGARISLSIGLIGVSITILLGSIVGGLAGYFGGWIDNVAMRITEFLMAIPGLYLLLALRSAFAQHFNSNQMYLLIVLILSFIGWSGTARVVRGLALSIRNRAFVQAAEGLGQSPWKILWKHIVPNTFSYLLVAATLSIPGYILGEAALSFLGLGIQEPSASWGLMLAQAQDMKIFMLNFWWMLLPGVGIFISVVCFNVLGDALRDLVDPKFKLINRS